MAIGDIWQLTVQGSTQGQAVNNVYYYLQVQADSEPNTLAEDLTNYFESLFLNPANGEGYACAAISNASSYSGIYTINLFDPLYFWDGIISPPVTGGFPSTDNMPPFVAYEAFSRRTRRDIRSGRKRIAGVPEAAQANGVVLQASLDELNNNFASLLGAQLNVSNGTGTVLFSPCVVKRIKETVDGKTTYRLPQNQAEAVTAPADLWVFSPALSTQSTRKIGRGI